MAHPRTKKILQIAGIVLASYVGLYVLDTAFGGYDPYPTSDGRDRYTSGLLVHDCIMWQPRFGSYCNEYRHDLGGTIFYPFIQLDQQFVHKTHCLADKDFWEWQAHLPLEQVHPAYRSAMREQIEKTHK